MTDNMGTFFFTCTYRLILRYLDACLYTVFKSAVIVNMKLGIQTKMLSRLVLSLGFLEGYSGQVWVLRGSVIRYWQTDKTGFAKSQVFLDLDCFKSVQKFSQKNFVQNNFEFRYMSSSKQFEILYVPIWVRIRSNNHITLYP